jgi:hypothetical protein
LAEKLCEGEIGLWVTMPYPGAQVFGGIPTCLLGRGGSFFFVDPVPNGFLESRSQVHEALDVCFQVFDDVFDWVQLAN